MYLGEKVVSENEYLSAMLGLPLPSRSGDDQMRLAI